MTPIWILLQTALLVSASLAQDLGRSPVRQQGRIRLTPRLKQVPGGGGDPVRQQAQRGRVLSQPQTGEFTASFRPSTPVQPIIQQQAFLDEPQVSFQPQQETFQPVIPSSAKSPPIPELVQPQQQFQPQQDIIDFQAQQERIQPQQEVFQQQQERFQPLKGRFQPQQERYQPQQEKFQSISPVKQQEQTFEQAFTRPSSPSASTSNKLRGSFQSLEDEAELFRQQAENAKYHFGLGVTDGIMDQQLQREETRDGVNVKGMYSYSDGYFKRTIHYEADRDGYRIVNEETEPIGDGPQEDPDGRADVNVNFDHSQLAYSVTKDDFRLPKQLLTRKPQQFLQQPQQRPFQDQQDFSPQAL